MDASTLQFEDVAVKSNSDSKGFSNLSIEVTKKEIFIGSSYKIKWKNVEEVKIFDADDYDSIGFSLSCFFVNNKNKNKTDVFQFNTVSRRNGINNENGNEGEDDDCDEREIRIFEVFRPVQPLGSRDFVSAWQEFHRTLKHFYEKELKKRTKKQERMEEERQRQSNQNKASSLSVSRRRRTYSKRKNNKYDRFLLKNKDNMERNAMDWTDSEDEKANDHHDINSMDDTVDNNHDYSENHNDDDDTVNQSTDKFVVDKIKNEATRKRFEEGIEEVEKVWKDQNDENYENEQSDDDNDGHNVGEEHEFNLEDGNDGDNSGLNYADQGKDTKNDTGENEENESVDLTFRSTTQTSTNAFKTTHNSSRKRRGPVLEDSEDDEDNEFSFNNMDGEDSEDDNRELPFNAKDEPSITTPAAAIQRVVSPTTTGLKQYEKKRQPSNIEHKGVNSDTVKTKQKQTKGIGAFFHRRPKPAKFPTKKITDSSVEEINAEDDTIESVKSDSTTQQRLSTGKQGNNSELETVDSINEHEKSIDEDFMDSNTYDRKSKVSNRNCVGKKKGSTSTDFFFPRKRSHSQTIVDDDDIVDDDSNGVEVIRKSPSKKLSRSTPEHENIGNAGKLVEDDDPIEEAVSSQSQSSPKYFSSSKRSKFPRKYSIRKNSAFKALDFADARCTNTPPTVRDRPHKETKSSSLSQVRKRLDLTSQMEQPPSMKWKGLQNHGNSCYINASLQQLFSVPKFIESISVEKDGLCSVLSKLWTDLEGRMDTNEDCVAASARPVKVLMDQLTDRFKGSQQHDSHEFLGELIDRIHDELSGSQESEINSKDNINAMPPMNSDNKDKVVAPAPVDEFFRWNVQVTLECKSCGYSRCKEETYRYLSIDIGNGIIHEDNPKFIKPRIDSCLSDFFGAEDRHVNCEKCKDGKVATQTMKILSKPKVALIHLKRFFVVEKQITDRNNCPSKEIVLQKNRVPVELTPKLSIDNLLAKKSISSEEYHLKSIVYHIGNTANSGHYTTDALRRHKEKDQWVSYDDGVTDEKSFDKTVQSTKNQKTAYMLTYERA